VDVAGKWGGVSVRSVEPEVLLGLSLGDVLLGLRETGDGQPDDTSVDSAGAGQGPVLRLRMPDGRVEREPLLGGFCRSDRTGRLTSPRVVTRREGEVLACKLYRAGEGGALYAGVLKAAGARASVEAAPGAGFRCRNSRLRRMTPEESAAAGALWAGSTTVTCSEGKSRPGARSSRGLSGLVGTRRRSCWRSRPYPPCPDGWDEGRECRA